MYQISADLVNRELRNATLEGKKTPNPASQIPRLVMLEIITFVFDVAPAGDDARPAVYELVEAGQADGAHARLYLELDRNLQSQDGRVVDRSSRLSYHSQPFYGYLCTYRVVQINLTPEFEVFYMLFDRFLSCTFSMTSLKHHMEYIHRVLVIWSSNIWSFWLYFGYMVNSQSDFRTKFFGYMVISAIWSTLSGQN